MTEEEDNKALTSIAAIAVTILVCATVLCVGVYRTNARREAARTRLSQIYKVTKDQPITFNVPEGTTSVVVKDCYPKNDSRVWICQIKMVNGGNNVSRNGNE